MDDPSAFLAGGQAIAWRKLGRSRLWPYRACAPAPGNPRAAAADPTVPVAAWSTPDHHEGSTARAAREEQALVLCARCPLRPDCLAYALGDTSGSPERWGIWGGMTAKQRRDHLAARARTSHCAATPDLDEPAPARAAPDTAPGHRPVGLAVAA